MVMACSEPDNGSSEAPGAARLDLPEQSQLGDNVSRSALVGNDVDPLLQGNVEPLARVDLGHVLLCGERNAPGRGHEIDGTPSAGQPPGRSVAKAEEQRDP